MPNSQISGLRSQVQTSMRAPGRNADVKVASKAWPCLEGSMGQSSWSVGIEYHVRDIPHATSILPETRQGYT